MESSLVELVYISRSTTLLKPFELESLLSDARTRNEEHDVTGLLLYKDSSFIQYLEGPQNAVDDIFGVIKRSSQHYNIRVLIEKNSIETRRFDKWWMGFPTMNQQQQREFTGLIDFLGKPPVKNSDETQSQALQLLDYFRLHS